MALRTPRTAMGVGSVAEMRMPRRASSMPSRSANATPRMAARKAPRHLR